MGLDQLAQIGELVGGVFVDPNTPPTRGESFVGRLGATAQTVARRSMQSM